MATLLSSSRPAPSLERIRQKLSRYAATRLADSSSLKHAAVALILRENAELLIIRRAEQPKDPWSGHLGFPGGRLEPRDLSPERAAVRETEEELGIALDRYARRLGSLSEIRARSLNERLPLSIFPFVYELLEPVPVQENADEVARACWVPLTYFANKSNRKTMPHPRDPRHVMACYPLGDRALWGMSLAMLDELLF
jgi:8-oxo-dGTP pyrophosphatase MutT (NUDIX family)